MKTPTKSKQVSKVKKMTRLEAANKINKQHQDYESKWVQTLPVPLLSQMKKYKCNVHGYKTLKWVTKSNKFMRVRHQIACTDWASWQARKNNTCAYNKIYYTVLKYIYHNCCGSIFKSQN